MNVTIKKYSAGTDSYREQTMPLSKALAQAAASGNATPEEQVVNVCDMMSALIQTLVTGGVLCEVDIGAILTAGQRGSADVQFVGIVPESST